MPGWEDTVFPVGLIRSGNSTTERPSQHGCCRGTSSGHGLFDFARWERGDGSLLAGRFRTGAWCAADLVRAKSSTLVDLPSPRSRFCLIRGGAGQLRKSPTTLAVRSTHARRRPAPVLSHWWGCGSTPGAAPRIGTFAEPNNIWIWFRISPIDSGQVALNSSSCNASRFEVEARHDTQAYQSRFP